MPTLYGAGARSGKSLAGRALHGSSLEGEIDRSGFSPGKEKDMAYVDQVLYCRDCNQEFTFTAGEQEFFASRGLTNAPTRCPSCRSARKQAGGGRAGAGRSYSGGSREREPRQMYSVTCANCGNQAQVPFQPRGDKPVYCGDCYQVQSPKRQSRW
jgi:CxxC-x17-CxxC domain-containing protein